MSHPLHEPDPSGQPEDDPQIRQMVDEANEILCSTHEHLQKHYPPFRDIYRNGYNWPEIDPLRWEICRCLFFGLFQAAITLTNHFLESLLKYTLIVNDGLKEAQTAHPDARQSVTDHFRETYGPGFAKYGNLDLVHTINRACSAGLITKEQKKQLHALREVFRNAWSHSDKAKTFGATQMPVQGLHWGDEGIEVQPQEMVDVASFLIGQSFAQIEIAKHEAPKYFAYVDQLARQICTKLFGENYKSGLGNLERD